MKHSEKIKPKFDKLNEMVSEGFNLPSVKDELNYLMNFPSDYGGLGDIYDEQNYENVNLFETKASLQKLTPVNRTDTLYIQLGMANPIINNNTIIPNTNNVPIINPIYPPQVPFPNNLIIHPQTFPYVFYPPQFPRNPYFLNQNFLTNAMNMNLLKNNPAPLK